MPSFLSDPPVRKSYSRWINGPIGIKSSFHEPIGNKKNPPIIIISHFKANKKLIRMYGKVNMLLHPGTAQ